MASTAKTYVPFGPGRTDACLPSGLPAMVWPSGPAGGSGSPEGVVIGNPGMRYRDLDNDDLYIKLHGTDAIGWLKIGRWAEGGSPGATVTGNVVASSVSPIGVLSVTGPAICIGRDAFAGSVWVKSTAGTSSADWVLLLTG